MRSLAWGALLLLAPAPLAAQGFSIQSEKYGCVVAERFPMLSACFAPAAGLARARVYSVGRVQRECREQQAERVRKHLAPREPG